MATRKRIEHQNGNDLGLVVLSGLAVAALTTPSLEQKQKLQYFEANENEIYYFHDIRPQFDEFLRHKSSYETYQREQISKNHRLLSLGNTTIDSSINNYTNAAETFDDSKKMFVNGFYRGSFISAIITIESILKEEFGRKRFIDLVDEAASKNLISESDKNHLHGLRLDRNDYIHTLSEIITEENAKIVILLTVRLLNNFLKNRKNII